MSVGKPKVKKVLNQTAANKRKSCDDLQTNGCGGSTQKPALKGEGDSNILCRHEGLVDVCMTDICDKAKRNMKLIKKISQLIEKNDHDNHFQIERLQVANDNMALMDAKVACAETEEEVRKLWFNLEQGKLKNSSISTQIAEKETHSKSQLQKVNLINDNIRQIDNKHEDLRQLRATLALTHDRTPYGLNELDQDLDTPKKKIT